MSRGLLPGVVALAIASCGRVGFDDDRGPASDALIVADAPALPDGSADAVPATANRAFITQSTWPGDLGDLAAIDARCQARADARGFGGTWQALITTSALERSSRFVGSRGWRDLAGTPIADSSDDLANGQLLTPLVRDEVALPAAATNVWLGDSNDRTCNDWTSASGAVDAGVGMLGEPWPDRWSAPCLAARPLACFEVGQVAPVALPTTTGRRAFATQGTWIPGGGIGGADALCAAEASAAGLPGTFLAKLTTSAVAAEARFSDGPTWVRSDGVALTATSADLFDPAVAYHAAAPIYDATGAALSGFPYVWTGNAIDNCLDWTSASAAERGLQGFLDSIRKSYFDGLGNTPCDGARRLVCLET